MSYFLNDIPEPIWGERPIKGFYVQRWAPKFRGQQGELKSFSKDCEYLGVGDDLNHAIRISNGRIVKLNALYYSYINDDNRRTYKDSFTVD